MVGITDKLKVLVIAEAANPEWVSVPLVGWSLASELRNIADIHIVTQVRNRDAFLRAGLTEGVDFTAINSELFEQPIWKITNALKMGKEKGSWTALQAFSALSYPYFERLIWKQFGGRIQAGEFDVVHRITPLSPTIPSPLAKKCKRVDVPFILGPLNGGVPWPAGFETERRQEREWLSYVRGAYKLLPGRDITLANADAILVGSRFTESEIPDKYKEKCVYIPENAIDPARFSRRSAHQSAPLKACFIGRMVPYKGPDMLLEAAAPLLRDGKMTLEMIGDGPLLEKLKKQVIKDQTQHAVNFHGWQSHEAVQDIVAKCGLLAFPSIREFGGGVVLEAMALGLPALVVDYGGPGELVTEKTGFKVPIGSRSEITDGFYAELEKIAMAPEALVEMGENARAYTREWFTWPVKAAQVAKVYEWVLDGRSSERPSFF